MKTSTVFIVVTLFAVSAAEATFRHHNDASFRLCVPDMYISYCNQMIAHAARHDGHNIQCVSAPDKIACIDRIIRGEADWMILDPEELYVAYRFLPDNGVVVTSEIRSEEYRDRNYRYAPSVVVRKSANIQNITDLRGKKSCHTAYGRNAGWKVPFSHLFLKGQLNCTAALPEGTGLERDLAVISQYFMYTCLPGRWSPDPAEDAALKTKYPQLCKLCKNPDTCSNNDEYAGYDGSLRCLTENQGDIAWTKYDAIQDFFKLKEGTPLPISEEYELLCRDGSRVPLNSENPCSWARRPWKTVVTSNHFSNNLEFIKDLRSEIDTYVTQAKESTEEPMWLTRILELKNRSDVIYHYEPKRVKILTPQQYLQPYNYSETFWHPSCGIYEKSLRICVYNQVELQKCQALKLAAIGQRISPGFSCVLGTCSGHCSALVSKGQADLLVADAKHAHKIQVSKRLNPKLVPILREIVSTNEANVSVPVRYAVAVINADIAGEFKGSLSPLRGKRSCHGSVRSLAGINIPLAVLRDAKELEGENCQLPAAAGNYFGQSCVPGVKKALRRFPDLNTTNLCGLCVGDGPNDPTPETVCSDSPNERYYGNTGALLCLKEEKADVAFVDHLAVLDVLNPVTSPTKDDIIQRKLLCKDGTVSELKNFRDCNWGMIGTSKILARAGDENRILRENARISLLRTQEAFKPKGDKSGVFKLFGDYYGTSNVIFQNSGIGLQAELSEQELLQEQQIIQDFNYCENKQAEGRAELEIDNEWKPVEQI